MAKPGRSLLLVLLLALGVRSARIAFWTPVVEIDGAEYCRLAENLMNGRGYEGLVAGPELTLPPLYPLAIAGVSLLTRLPPESAGRLLSLAASLIFTAAVFLFCRRRFGLGAARTAGLLAALLPIGFLSGSAVFAEALNLALLALALPLIARPEGSRLRSLAAGVLFGLAWLTRIESFLLALGAGILLLIPLGQEATPPRRRALLAAIFFAACLLVASPYLVYLQHATGKAGWNAKSGRVMSEVALRARGASWAEANYGLERGLVPKGPWLEPTRPYAGPSPLELLTAEPAAILRHVFKGLARIASLLFTGQSIMSLFFLPVFLLAFRRGWSDATTRRTDLFLLWIVAVNVGTVALYRVALRYLAPLLLPVVIWTARGLSGDRPFGTSRLRGALVLGVLLLSTGRGFVSGFKEYDEASVENLPVKELGLALADLGGGGAIMGIDARVAHYAGSRFDPLPAAPDLETFAAWVRRRGSRCVVLPPPPTRSERPGPFAATAAMERSFTRWRVLDGFEVWIPR